MKIIIYSIIFLIVVVLYIHIIYHLKISKEENVYEIDYTNNKNLNEMCDLRQPFTFKFNNNLNINKQYLDKINYNFNIIKQINKEIKKDKENENNSETINLIYSEYNNTINDNIYNEIIKLNKIISPDFSSYNKYDIIYSDEDFTTSITSNYNYRNFFVITEGNVQIKFISHLHNEKLNYNIDYELLQNISDYNIWNNDKKIKSLEINASKGDIIYIPPQWWYSIKFLEKTTIVKYHYRSIMNLIAYLPHYIYSYVSTQKAVNESKKKFLKKHNTDNKY